MWQCKLYLSQGIIHNALYFKDSHSYNEHYEQSQTRNSAIIIRIFPHEAFEGRLEDRSSQS